ncbi:hypothetical protein [Chryseobacterium luquanense]|uniref:Uncharacterized protein n=1 Tax=Chryseobacterium luquanense TaxID=2983766 RepID=A0ABT3Y4X1_9FLAO|nr:hypothetical protein [Chryseobacterium luquanense]MCX8533195.1 hypothetical protein [Chryseobacterium luquanense]
MAPYLDGRTKIVTRNDVKDENGNLFKIKFHYFPVRIILEERHAETETFIVGKETKTRWRGIVVNNQ